MNETTQTDLAGEEKLDTNVQVGGKDIQAVTGEDEVENILGWIAIYTVGPAFRVGRSWLEEEANELGIDPKYLPSETSPKRAHTRASNLLVNETGGILPAGVEANVERDDYSTFDLEITDRREDETKMEVIGQLIYDSGEVFTQADTSDPEMLDIYQQYARAWNELYEEMAESNLGKDIRTMVRDFMTDHTTSVRMREGGAVYFVPAHYEEMLTAFTELMDRINVRWKDRGHNTGIDVVEVIDSPAKRDMVEEKVRQTMDGAVESLIEDALDELDEEEAANEVVSSLSSELGDIESLAAEHNALLSADISVRQALEDWKDRVRNEQQEELVEKLAQSVDV